MLARDNRVTSGADYRRISRRGRRVTGVATVSSVVSSTDGTTSRFGFIITRKIGNAVVRNRLRRRLKAACRDLLDAGMAPREMVIRALPAAVTADWVTLRREIETAAMKGVR